MGWAERAVFASLVSLAAACGDSGDSALSSTSHPASATFTPPESDASAATATGEVKVPFCLPPHAALVPAPVPCDGNDTLADALGSVSLDRCSMSVSPTTAFAGPAVRRPRWLAGAANAPLGFVAAMATWGHALDDAAATRTPVAATLGVARAAFDEGAPMCEPVEARGLAAVLAARGLYATKTEATARAAVARVPPALDLALGPIVDALADAHAVVRAQIPESGAARDALVDYASFMMWSAPAPPTKSQIDIVSQLDLAPFAAAAAKLALAIERAPLAQLRDAATGDIDIDTSIGRIALRGPGPNVEDAVSGEHIALWLDTGGDDRHRAAAGAASPAQPVSVLIDLGGADRYDYATSSSDTATKLAADESGRLASGRTKSRVPRQGAGYLGIGLAFDFGTDNDVYRSLAFSQGAGVFGVGVLFDQGGDDDYAAEALAQGAAIAGIGLAIDGGGNDVRKLFVRGQGYGAANGVGIAFDASGDDRYRADPGDPKLGGELLYPNDFLTRDKSPVKGNHNAAQGFGEGRRDLDASGLVAAGGLGVLRDAAGNDRYEAGAFAQGAALEEGAGALLDARGNDVFEGLAYVQGAGIHRGVALLDEGGGDDRFNAAYPVQATSVGVGHDYGVGLLVDRGGRDAVTAPTLSLGSGSANGIGVYLAIGGDDSFVAATSAAYGAALENGVTGARQKEPTVGVFCKVLGQSKYSVGNRVRDYADEVWHPSNDAKHPALRSVGIDSTKGHLDL